MNIAHIVCTYPPYYGGMGNVAFYMANALHTIGHNVVVYTPHYMEGKEIRSAHDLPSLSHHSSLHNMIARVERLTPSFSYGNAARLPTLAKELEAYDLVHLHYPFFGTASLVASWKKKYPQKSLVVTYHMDTRSAGWKGILFSLYAKYYMPHILQLADAVHVSSFDYASSSDAAALYRASTSRWHAIPFGVDTLRFSPGEKPVELFVRHGLDIHKSTLLFVGGMDRAHYFKGIPVLLEALRIAKQQHACPQVVLVGEGELRTEFEHMAREYDLTSFVRFVGSVSDKELPAYYRMADVFVLPSIHRAEAFGMVLLEAMASGVPVIASDLPGVRTVAKEAGILVPPQHPRALAQHIQDFFRADEAVRVSLATKARYIVEHSYTWNTVAERLHTIYTSLR